jgi:hypothetical protein
LKVKKEKKSPLPLQRRKNLEGGEGGGQRNKVHQLVAKEKEVNSKGSRGWRTQKKLCTHSKGEKSWMRKSEKLK